MKPANAPQRVPSFNFLVEGTDGKQMFVELGLNVSIRCWVLTPA